ncbi:MAG: type II toxin-antitoxin system prevent-host-death family antitoxin [Candidatus Margulisbacteria bacterium]|jgi:prevent-host-death family protein|nr:type II toxin-antitoxin system prevent-host-death family antitoxin [Candidatus Margulisiibacteriota bacterium]
MKPWQLQEAKAKFSEVVRASAESPQQITLRGKNVAVLLSNNEYEKLVNANKPKQSLYELLQSSSFAEVKLDLRRNKDRTMRKIDL